MVDVDEVDLEYGDERHAWPAPYGFSLNGLRFYRFGIEEEDEDELPSLAEVQPDDGSGWINDSTVAAEASRAAVQIGALVGGRGHWRCIPTGGAEGSDVIELIALAGSTLAVLMNLLRSPGAAREAWDTLAALLGKMRASTGNDWHVGTEVAVLKCLAEIQRDWPGAFTEPSAVRVVQDGHTAALWADLPVGVHVIVIPDLQHEKTHIFAIDSQLNIQGRMMLDRLTADAQMFDPCERDRERR